jgi:hypothetical protein
LEELSIDVRMAFNWTLKVIGYKDGAWNHLAERAVLV